MAVRDDVYKALETARNEKVIGKSLDAKVTITQPADFNLADIKGSLEQFFIVSQVKVADTLADGTEYDVVTVKVEHADGERCNRCWNYSTADSIVSGHDDICPRCREVVDNA